MIALNDTTRSTIENALRVAATIYESDAQKMHGAGQYRIAEQFERQHRAALKAANMIEQADTIAVDGVLPADVN